MTFSSSDPRALAVVHPAGMRPWWPLLYLEIDPARSAAPTTAASRRGRPTSTETAALSRRLDRHRPHARLRVLGVAARGRRFVVAVDGRRRGRRLGTARAGGAGPLARPRLDRSGRGSGPAALADAARGRGRRAPSVRPCPGRTRPCTRLLERGVRIDGPRHVLRHRPRLVDPARIVRTRACSRRGTAPRGGAHASTSSESR